MGRIFIDATPEQEQAFIEERRKKAFLAACLWPVSWAMPADRHKRAADYLYEVACAAEERQEERFRRDMYVSGSRILEGEELADHRDTTLLLDYYLLCGYAFECLLKGILLMKRPELVRKQEKLDGLVTSHNLTRLTRECGISIDAVEVELLDALSRQVLWGKYPVPRELKDMPSPVDPDRQLPESPELSNAFRGDGVRALVDRLYGRVAGEFRGCREVWLEREHSPELAAGGPSE